MENIQKYTKVFKNIEKMQETQLLEGYQLLPHRKILKGNRCFEGIKIGVGKPLLYPLEIDQEILVWFVEMTDFHFPNS